MAYGDVLTTDAELDAGLSRAWALLNIHHDLPYMLQDRYSYVQLMQEVQQEKIAA